MILRRFLLMARSGSPMLEILLCLASGFLAARLLRLRINPPLRPLAYTLILLIGLRVGSEGLSSLPEIILQSLLMALLTLSGSIIAVRAIRRMR